MSAKPANFMSLLCSIRENWYFRINNTKGLFVGQYVSQYVSHPAKSSSIFRSNKYVKWMHASEGKREGKEVPIPESSWLPGCGGAPRALVKAAQVILVSHFSLEIPPWPWETLIKTRTFPWNISPLWKHLIKTFPSHSNFNLR